MDRKSSIETEPRTLRFDQIQYARDAAIYVVRTKSREEAMSIFTEGLEPVGSIAMAKQNTLMDSSDDEEDYSGFHTKFSDLRDIVSAPF